LPRANGILTPPMIATRRALDPTNIRHLPRNQPLWTEPPAI
jgi:hypothetical protein